MLFISLFMLPQTTFMDDGDVMLVHPNEEQAYSLDYSSYIPTNEEIRSADDLDQIICTSCSLSFKFRWELLKHKKLKHNYSLNKLTLDSQEPQKFYKCDICGYQTLVKCNFTRHYRTHTGERPYKCDLCPYKATQQTNLDKHKPLHNCGFCKFRSGDKRELLFHRKTHQM